MGTVYKFSKFLIWHNFSNQEIEDNIRRKIKANSFNGEFKCVEHFRSRELWKQRFEYGVIFTDMIIQLFKIKYLS